MAARLREKYQNEVRVKLQERFHYKNPMQVPKLEKVVINMSVGDAIQNSKALEAAVNELRTISGQKPVVTKANGCLPPCGTLIARTRTVQSPVSGAARRTHSSTFRVSDVPPVVD